MTIKTIDDIENDELFCSLKESVLQYCIINEEEEFHIKTLRKNAKNDKMAIKNSRERFENSSLNPKNKKLGDETYSEEEKDGLFNSFHTPRIRRHVNRVVEVLVNEKILRPVAGKTDTYVLQKQSKPSVEDINSGEVVLFYVQNASTKNMGTEKTNIEIVVDILTEEQTDLIVVGIGEYILCTLRNGDSEDFVEKRKKSKKNDKRKKDGSKYAYLNVAQYERKQIRDMVKKRLKAAGCNLIQ